MLQQLEGLPMGTIRHTLPRITASPLRTIVLLEAKGNDEEGLLMTQFPKEIVESVGLFKD